tara:strand:- start:3947 stop:5251 length:1305 start_codon:yes stop_codon:yes gene_type:complete
MRILKEGGIYLLSSVLEKALPFILLPFLTRILTVDEYGLIAMFSTLVAMYSLAGSTGLHGFIRVIYHKVEVNKFKQYVGISFSIAIFLYILVVIFTVVFNPVLEKITGLYFNFLFLALLVSVAMFVINMRLVIYQTSRNPYEFAKLQLLKLVLEGMFVLILIFYLEGGGKERVYSMVLACVIAALLSLVSLSKDSMLNLSWDNSYAKHIMGFVFPALPHSLILSSVFVIDKVVLSSFVGLSMVGEVAVALSLAMPMLVIAESFNRAFMPWSFDKLQKSKFEQVVGGSYFLLIIMFILSIAYSFFLIVFFDYLVGDDFLNTLVPTLILVWAGWLKLAYYLAAKGLLFIERVGVISYISFISSVVYFILLLANIETITLIDFSCYVLSFHFMMAFGVFLLSQKLFPQPWGRLRALKNVMEPVYSKTLFCLKRRNEN